MKRLLYLIPVGVFAAFGILFYAGLQDGPPTVLPSPFVGKQAPEFAAVAFDPASEAFTHGDLAKGHPVIVNFWASWCAPCRLEAPVLQDLAQVDGVTLYGVVYKDEPEDARQFLSQFGNPFSRITDDRSGRIGIDWGLTGVPETFVIDGEGIVRARYAGPLTDRVVSEIILPAAGL